MNGQLTELESEPQLMCIFALWTVHWVPPPPLLFTPLFPHHVLALNHESLDARCSFLFWYYVKFSNIIISHLERWVWVGDFHREQSTLIHPIGNGLMRGHQLSELIHVGKLHLHLYLGTMEVYSLRESRGLPLINANLMQLEYVSFALGVILLFPFFLYNNCCS